MKELIKWLKGFLSENGEASSKRFVGVFSGIALCITLYRNNDSEALIYSVAALSAAALGITAAEKIFKKSE